MSQIWIFNADDLEKEIVEWIEAQKATGHPKAVANADFVGEAIKDFLYTRTDLYKDPPKTEQVSGEELVEAFDEKMGAAAFGDMLKNTR